MNKQIIREISAAIFCGLSGLFLFIMGYVAICVWAKVPDNTMSNASFLPAILGIAAGVWVSTYLTKDKTNVT